ncbi:adenosylcobinamide-phosphate synthase CbiB [Butyrivibrio sp. FCS014]|uniref:adenosylcobinamide-phosphate synthase CbiB n=1 Tax=Butyrivibrio sp. FCS014 TaxID=1408304 RepID=UPI0004B2477E|nr:adenosylcobinamide-phosphate synthase CbiB [Butyrivibrio sp. FCS014]
MGNIITCHLLAFTAGFILDLIIGDPYGIPHPIRWIGSFISFLEKRLRDEEEKAGSKKNRLRGLILWLLVMAVTICLTLALVFVSYRIHFVLGIIIEAILTCYCLAAKSLKSESMKVYDALLTKDIASSRKAVSMIVGRDTACLDEAGVTKAAVETVAENTSDGVIAPLLYAFIGGPVLGMAYKAVNTMDSMIGYHNDRYEDFGFFAARIDDVCNFLPARISALLMIAGCMFLGKEYDAAGAFLIFKRDRYNHKSPNSAQTESALAGALSIRLAGDASYFGKIVKKPFIGDDLRPIEPEDIIRANKLMYITAFLAFIICAVILLIIAM